MCLVTGSGSVPVHTHANFHPDSRGEKDGNWTPFTSLMAYMRKRDATATATALGARPSSEGNDVAKGRSSPFTSLMAYLRRRDATATATATATAVGQRPSSEENDVGKGRWSPFTGLMALIREDDVSKRNARSRPSSSPFAALLAGKFARKMLTDGHQPQLPGNDTGELEMAGKEKSEGTGGSMHVAFSLPDQVDKKKSGGLPAPSPFTAIRSLLGRSSTKNNVGTHVKLHQGVPERANATPITSLAVSMLKKEGLVKMEKEPPFGAPPGSFADYHRGAMAWEGGALPVVLTEVKKPVFEGVPEPESESEPKKAGKGSFKAKNEGSFKAKNAYASARQPEKLPKLQQSKRSERSPMDELVKPRRVSLTGTDKHLNLQKRDPSKEKTNLGKAKSAGIADKVPSLHQKESAGGGKVSGHVGSFRTRRRSSILADGDIHNVSNRRAKLASDMSPDSNKDSGEDRRDAHLELQDDDNDDVTTRADKTGARGHATRSGVQQPAELQLRPKKAPIGNTSHVRVVANCDGYFESDELVMQGAETGCDVELRVRQSDYLGHQPVRANERKPANAQGRGYTEGSNTALRGTSLGDVDLEYSRRENLQETRYADQSSPALQAAAAAGNYRSEHVVNVNGGHVRGSSREREKYGTVSRHSGGHGHAGRPGANAANKGMSDLEKNMHDTVPRAFL